MATRTPRPIRQAGLLVVAVLLLDLAWSLVAASTGSLAYALIDEPAHLATCLLALMALVAIRGRRLSSSFVAAALVGSVAIDLDHVPHYLGSNLLVEPPMPRPYTHSVLVVLLLAGLALTMRDDRREVALGLAFGVGAHLFRDVATGPGASVLWPLTAGVVSVPYLAYAVAMLVLPAAVAFSEWPRTARRRLRPIAARPLPDAGPPGGS